MSTDLDLGNATILVVEDQEAVLKMVTRHLKRHNYTIIQARSAEEAWALYEQASESIDLVLTDIILPGLSGVDLCRKIGRGGPRLLLMSGYTEQAPELDEETLPLLAKPFILAELLHKVQETLA
jgi:DNA-binding response OmpR family regulator